MKVYEVIETHKTLCVVGEYIDGHELLRVISENPQFNEEAAAWYIKDLLLTLLHLHENGVICKDLSPSSCLLQVNARRMTIKVLYYGISTKITPCSNLQNKTSIVRSI